MDSTLIREKLGDAKDRALEALRAALRLRLPDKEIRKIEKVCAGLERLQNSF